MRVSALAQQENAVLVHFVWHSINTKRHHTNEGQFVEHPMTTVTPLGANTSMALAVLRTTPPPAQTRPQFLVTRLERWLMVDLVSSDVRSLE